MFEPGSNWIKKVQEVKLAGEYKPLGYHRLAGTLMMWIESSSQFLEFKNHGSLYFAIHFIGPESKNSLGILKNLQG